MACPIGVAWTWLGADIWSYEYGPAEAATKATSCVASIGQPRIGPRTPVLWLNSMEIESDLELE